MLNGFMNDGANWQAQSVAAFIAYHDGIESSWDGNDYSCKPTIARWHNGREQGYVISIRLYRDRQARQLNIAFFEHRNSDSICAVMWEQVTMNPPTIDTAQFGNVYQDKYDTSHDVRCGDILGMGNWIIDQMEEYYKKHAID